MAFYMTLQLQYNVITKFRTQYLKLQVVNFLLCRMSFGMLLIQFSYRYLAILIPWDGLQTVPKPNSGNDLCL